MLVRRYTLVAFKFVLLRHVQDEGTENKGLMMKHCMICGRWNEDDDKFCTGCGSSLAQSEVSIPQPSGETNVRVCSSCGAVNELSSRFCTACGKPLDADPGTVTRSSDHDAAQTSVMSAFPMSAVPLPSAPAPIAGGATTPSVPAPASPTQPIQIPVLTPPRPAAPTPVSADPDDPAAMSSTNTEAKNCRFVLIIVTVVVAIALVISGVLVWRSNNSKDSQPQTATVTSSATANSDKKNAGKKPEKSPAAKASGSASSDTASRVLDKQVMDAIVDTYNSGSGSAAVSVMTSDNLKSYSSDNASYSMSAAGLYLPPWLAYYDVVGGSPAGGYQSVLSSMDNGKANELIDRDGGMDMLNSWLNAHDYDETRFGHLYGDVNASENGYDNTTSSDDAAKMLTQLITKGEDGLLNYNVASDGVVVPDGATVHAHRGMGVGDAYDYYMVVSNGSKKVVVVVLTEGQAKEQAASLTSNVLKQVWQKMFVSGK